MNAQPAPVQECALLVFRVAGQRFAADPREVLRVDRVQPFLPLLELLPTDSKRVLVANGARGEFQVPVDAVEGVHRLPASLLRRPPPVAVHLGGPRVGELMGMVLEGETPLLIVDMKALSARVDGPAQS